MKILQQKLKIRQQKMKIRQQKTKILELKSDSWVFWGEQMEEAKKINTSLVRKMDDFCI